MSDATFKLGRNNWVCPVVAILSEKDLKYLVKLIHNDINYRTKRAADRVYSGNGNGDQTVIAKASQLQDQITKILEWEDNNARVSTK